MAKAYLKDLPSYGEYTTDQGEVLVRDENGEIDYTKKLVNVPTRAQSSGYSSKIDKMKSMSFDSFGVDQESEINSSFFIFMVYQPMKLFLQEYPELTKGDYARLVYLSTFLKRNGTEIKIGKRTYAKRKDIKSILDVPERTARAFLKRAESNNFIFEDRNGNMNISEHVFKNGRVGGTTRSRNFTRIFIKNTQQLYKQFKKGKAIDKLGVLYSLVPYLDLRYNVLCKNANGSIEDISDIEPLTMADLAEILGYSDSFALKRSLRSLKVEIDGVTYSAVAFHEIGELDNALVSLSPFFLYRDMPADWMTKETHLIFYQEILRQVKTSGEYQGDDHQQQIQHIEAIISKMWNIEEED